MRSIIIFLFLFYDLSSYSQENDTIIFWSESELLKWADFNAEEDSLSFPLSHGGYANAITVVGIEVVEMNLDCYRLQGTFYKNASWTTTNRNTVLVHEQGHFDLMELVARNLRKKLLKKKEQCQEFSFYDEIGIAYDMYDSLSTFYDKSTKHGIYDMPQNIWNEKIQSGLDSLKDYTGDIVICYCE
ncbi:MAG: hypothetical protein AAF600_21170 [Bacteroidota bacterium]